MRHRVNFINILRSSFTLADPKGQTDTDDLTFFLRFLLTRVKAVRKRVGEIDAW